MTEYLHALTILMNPNIKIEKYKKYLKKQKPQLHKNKKKSPIVY